MLEFITKRAIDHTSAAAQKKTATAVGMATGTEYPCARGQKPERVRVWV
jgi:hypothetical protein